MTATMGFLVKGAFQFNLAKPPGSTWNSPASTTYFSNQWVHAVLVCVGGTNMLCYTNGAVMFNRSWTTNNYMSEGNFGTHKLPLVIGSYCVTYGTGSQTWGFERGNFWHGGMAHLALSTNALPPNRILAHYAARTNAVVAPPSPPVMAVQLAGSNVVISWTTGMLQSTLAFTNTNTWTDVSNAVSPYTVPRTNTARFFRAWF